LYLSSVDDTAGKPHFQAGTGTTFYCGKRTPMTVEKLDLCGTWKLTDYPHGKGEAKRPYLPKTKTEDWLDTPVPGDIHPTLVRAGRIPDPCFGDNVERCKWTSEREWWFRKDFRVPRRFLRRHTELVFDGIDTYGTVWLNGQLVGETQNMFRSYRFDVSKVVKPGEKNVLVVRVGATLPTVEKYPWKKYFACFNVPRIFCRKIQCQFGWDWAPHLPALGMWQPVRLETFDPGRIMTVAVRTRTDGNVSFFLELDERPQRQDLDQSVTSKGEEEMQRPQGKFRLRINGPDGFRLSRTFPVRGQKNHFSVKIPSPQLWWPSGLGEQPLYEYAISLMREGREHHRWSGRFGIREVALIEDPRPEGGFSFRFRINGVDTFCKGANWVPADCFPATVSEEKYRYLLRLVKEANFNMLRLWGGGMYEQDLFYDLCDELGIMVWQDLMFACSDYPDDHPWFVEVVIPELEHQVKRLRNHPSVVYWAGGNEKTGSAGFLVSYGERLFHTIGRGVVNDLDPTRPYRPASPQSYSDLGNDQDSGDTHASCWERAYERGIEHYREVIDGVQTVFNSEFGTHGPGRYRSLVKFIPPEHLWPPDDMWELHVQDNPYNSIPETYLQVQLKMAERLFGKLTGVRDFLKKGATVHAEILRGEMEHHRRRKGINWGALFWMFADTWPCGSWAVVDYFGLPKPAYYFAKRAAEPIMVSIHQAKAGFEVFACNDTLRDIKGNLRFGQGTLTGPCLWETRMNVRLPANESKCLTVFPKKVVRSSKDTYLFAEFRGRGVRAETVFFHHLWKHIPWPDPELRSRVVSFERQHGEYAATVDIRAKHFARMVNLTTGEDIWVHLSDNFFDLMPGQRKRIVIRSRERFDPDNLIVAHWLDDWE
jgi:beta-mannosidase